MNNVIEGILSAFRSASFEIEAMIEYYNRTSQSLLQYRINSEKEFLPGKKLSEYLDELLNIDDKEERNKLIPLILEREVKQGLLVNDVCEIFKAEQDEEKSIFLHTNQKYEKEVKYAIPFARRKYDLIEKNEYILIESILSHIIVIFENYLSVIYRILLQNNPLVYFEDQKMLLADIFKNGIKDTLNSIFETHINKAMYDSIDTLKTISQKEKISLASYSDIKNDFLELYYRRNAYVHTRGKANKEYLKKVDNSLTEGINENDLLVSDDLYIKHAISVLNKVIFSSTFELIGKQDADEDDYGYLFNYGFKLLLEEEYEVSLFVFDKLRKNKNVDFQSRLMGTINYIISAKQLGKNDIVNSELKKLDVSACNEKYVIAKLCISDKYKLAYELLKKSYPDSFDSFAISEWPLFIGFRETQFYKDFISLHEKDFQLDRVDYNQDDEHDDENDIIS